MMTGPTNSLSFPHQRESIHRQTRSKLFGTIPKGVGTQKWIPAGAGMTNAFFGRVGGLK